MMRKQEQMKQRIKTRKIPGVSSETAFNSNTHTLLIADKCELHSVFTELNLVNIYLSGNSEAFPSMHHVSKKGK